jgi:hypothetical protein
MEPIPNPLVEGLISEGFTGLGTVTGAMVRQRAQELAVINGRTVQEISKTDWEQAKRELAGNEGLSPEELTLDSIPESERWDPVPGTVGHPAPEILGEDVDDDGLSLSARLVEQGISQAEHDQRLQAARTPRKDVE